MQFAIKVGGHLLPGAAVAACVVWGQSTYDVSLLSLTEKATSTLGIEVAGILEKCSTQEESDCKKQFI